MATANMGLPQAGFDKIFFSILSLPIIGYVLDRSLIVFRFKQKFRSFMGIIMGSDTATNTQPAASPGRYMQAVPQIRHFSY